MIPDSMNAIAAPIISASYPIFSACLLSESIPNPLVLPRIAPRRDETPVSPRSLAAVDLFTKSFATAHPTERYIPTDTPMTIDGNRMLNRESANSNPTVPAAPNIPAIRSRMPRPTRSDSFPTG